MGEIAKEERNMGLDWKLDYGNWLTWLAVFGITLVITQLSYMVFEKWIPAIKRR